MDASEAAGDGLKVVAQLESLSVSLNAERSGERLALLAMKHLGADVQLPAGGGRVVQSGAVGDSLVPKCSQRVSPGLAAVRHACGRGRASAPALCVWQTKREDDVQHDVQLTI